MVKRLAIVGPVASGKTTLARRLGPILGLPVHDLDDFYWRRDTRPAEAAWVAEHRALIAAERWIISGDYRALAPERFKAADAVIWLDLPRRTCLVRATRRKLKGNPTPLLDCWRWIWRYPTHGRRDTAAELADPALTCTVRRVHSSAGVTSILAALGR
jgi:nicotinamide riboside kinase